MAKKTSSTKAKKSTTKKVEKVVVEEAKKVVGEEVEKVIDNILNEEGISEEMKQFQRIQLLLYSQGVGTTRT